MLGIPSLETMSCLLACCEWRRSGSVLCSKEIYPFIYKHNKGNKVITLFTLWLYKLFIQDIFGYMSL